MANDTNRGINIFFNEPALTAALERSQRTAAKLEQQMKDVGDKSSPEFLKLQQQFDNVNKKISETSARLNGQLAPSLRQATAETKKAWNELNNLPVGSAEWKAKLAEFSKLNTELVKLKGEVSEVGKVMNGLSSGIPTIAIGNFIANGVSKGIEIAKGLVSDFFNNTLAKSDAFSDISKTTGQTTREVRNLDEALKDLEGRTAIADLEKIAAVGGQFNIAKNQLDDFSGAVDKINVALGDEFGGGAENVATQVTVLRNLFTDIKSQDVGSDLLYIGNALNQLGNEGAATSDVVADFSNRIGGVAIPLGFSSGQVLGLSATLQELGVNAERGGTAVSKILQKMTTNTKDFAKVAGIDIKTFTDMVNNDLYGAFIKVIEGAQKGGASATALGKILEDTELSGAGASEVFLKLGTNIELLNNKVDVAGKALKNTDSIMQEFRAKNNNLAGEVAILQKRLAEAFESGDTADALSKLVHWIVRLTDETDKATQAARREFGELIQVESRILDVNTAQEDRVKLIKELQEQYPDYLKNIDAEKVSNEELTKAFVGLNQQMIARITLATQEDKIEAAQKRASDIQTKRLEQEDKARQLMADAIEQFKLEQSSILNAGTITDQVDATVKQLDAMRNTMGFIKFAAKDQKGIYQEISIAQGFLNKYFKQENDAINESNKLLEYKNELAKRLGVQLEENKKVEETKTDTKDKKTPEPTATDEQLEQYAKFKEKIFALDREIEAADIDNNAKEVQRLREKYTALEQEAKRFQDKSVIDEVEYQNRFLQIESIFSKEFAQLRKKQYGNDEELALQASLNTLDKYYQQQLLIQKDALAKGKIGKQQYDIQVEAIDLLSKETQLNTFLSYYDRIAAVYANEPAKLEKLEQQKTRLLEAALSKRIAINLAAKQRENEAIRAQDNADLINAQISGDSGAIRNARLKQIDDELKIKLELYKGNEAKINEAIAQAAAARIDIEKQASSEIKDAIIQGLSGAADIYSSIANIQKNFEDAELARDKKANDKKKEEYKKQLDAKILTQEQYQRKVEALDKAADKKAADIKKKQFERDRALRIANAIMNTAAAVVSALGTSGNIAAGIALAAIAGAMGAAQIAVIASEPVPEFGDGGKMDGKRVEGPSHKSKSRGLWVINPETGKQVMRIEGKEWVVNTSSSEKYDDLIHAINKDDRSAINSWFYKQPHLNYTAIKQERENNLDISGLAYDDSRLRRTVHNGHIESAKHIVDGVVRGFQQVNNVNNRKL